MRLICLILVMLLLCGCSAAPIGEETAEPTTAPTLPPETEPPTTPPPDPVEELLDAMTTEEKVGQLFLARCPGGSAMADIETYHLGGYVLFGQDFDGQTPDTVTDTLSAYQEAAAVPLLIAVDEEGGTVCRVSSNPSFRSSRFPSPRSLYDRGGLALALSMEIEKGYLLSSLGINVNLGPVCDVTTGSGAFMYQRSLGQEPTVTGFFAVGAVNQSRSFGVGSVLKHFPGYGNNADTHTGIAVDNRSLEELENRDLVPFAMAIRAGCDAIMVSHTIVTALDQSLPASLSPAVHDYLRENMGFEGVIVTDDLVMDAITKTYGTGEAAVLAVLAGNDLLCSTEYQAQYRAVLEAVESGRISTEHLNRAVERILRWKQRLSLI